MMDEKKSHTAERTIGDVFAVPKRCQGSMAIGEHRQCALPGDEEGSCRPHPGAGPPELWDCIDANEELQEEGGLSVVEGAPMGAPGQHGVEPIWRPGPGPSVWGVSGEKLRRRGVSTTQRLEAGRQGPAEKEEGKGERELTG
ncbi:hypothetical protein Vafri_19883, partial [Volvox africanus]